MTDSRNHTGKASLRSVTALLLSALSLSMGTLSGAPAVAADTATGTIKGGKLGAVVGTADLTLDPQALSLPELIKKQMGYMPSAIPLSTEKPAGIVKEPAYLGTPRYAVLHVGNGPSRDTFLVVDDKPGGGGKLYVDSNRNGDLTDETDSAWSQETSKDGNIYYGITQRLVRASWADPKDPAKETSSGPYSFGFYYTVGSSMLALYGQTARVGVLAYNGKQIPVLLAETYADGIFDRSAAAPAPAPPGGTAAAAARPRPITLYVNESGSGSNALPALKGVLPQRINIAGPFRMDGRVYEARVTPDGSKLTLYTSDAKVPEPPKLPPMPNLLSVGQNAPDFTCLTPDGKKVKLSDFKGKMVVLDFWATWCGPCQASMPHLEGVYNQLKSRDDATVLAVCVSDERGAFDKWVGANIGSKYTFPVAFDPAGRDAAKGISRNKFGVSGIPTQFVIGKDGKVAAVFVGYRGASDHRLEEALNQAGIAVTAPAEPAQTAAAN